MSQASLPWQGHWRKHLQSVSAKVQGTSVRLAATQRDWDLLELEQTGNSRELLFSGWRKQSRCSQRSTRGRRSAAAWSFCSLCATTRATLHQCYRPKLMVPDHSRPHIPALFLHGQVLPCNEMSGQCQATHQLHAGWVADHPGLPLAAQTRLKRPKSQRTQCGEQTGGSRCTPQLLHAAEVPEVLPGLRGHPGTELEPAVPGEHLAGHAGLEGPHAAAARLLARGESTRPSQQLPPEPAAPQPGAPAAPGPASAARGGSPVRGSPRGRQGLGLGLGLGGAAPGRRCGSGVRGQEAPGGTGGGGLRRGPRQRRGAGPGRAGGPAEAQAGRPRGRAGRGWRAGGRRQAGSARLPPAAPAGPYLLPARSGRRGRSGPAGPAPASAPGPARAPAGPAPSARPASQGPARPRGPPRSPAGLRTARPGGRGAARCRAEPCRWEAAARAGGTGRDGTERSCCAGGACPVGWGARGLRVTWGHPPLQHRSAPDCEAAPPAAHGDTPTWGTLPSVGCQARGHGVQPPPWPPGWAQHLRTVHPC